MQKTKKTLLFSILIWLSTIPAFLTAQNIYWLESKFDAPRLVKSDTSGNELQSRDLTSGSLPQSMALNALHNNLLLTSLAFNDARLTSVSFDFSQSEEILDRQSALRGLAVDEAHSKIFWISSNLIEGPKIWRSDLNGQSPTVLKDFGPASNSTPRSIALDHDTGKIYWTNFAEGKIQRADTTVSAMTEDIITGLNGPSGLDIDPVSAKIFWTEMNGHQIKSADLDGNNIALLAENLSYPASINVNHDLNRMVWTETGSGKIKSAYLDGSGIFEYKITAVAPAAVIFEPPAPLDISGYLKVQPPDSTIQIHSFLQYKAHIVDSNDVSYPVDASWFVKRDRVGPVTKDGLLFSYFPGRANIMAKYDSMEAKARLTVVDTTADSTGINTIKIAKKHPRGNGSKDKILKEGETYTVAGLPSPYNIINGSMLYFPKGSLHEDISLEIDIPPFHKIKNDSIDFANRIINGITFNVFTGDSLIEPYYFARPLSISIPFKRGLLKKYGINPENLTVYYATDSTTFDTTGISHIMVDTSRNRIYATVEHFSSLVLREKDKSAENTNTTQDDNIPVQFELKQNYPNPFNPVTTICYQVAKSADITLSVYNLLGQKVATLVNKKQSAGSYSVQWDGRGFASGIYIYTMETSTGIRQSKKLVLIR